MANLQRKMTTRRRRIYPSKPCLAGRQAWRRRTKTVKIGQVKIGGSNPISIQSMTKVDTSDVSLAVRGIKRLERAGCEIIRVAVKNKAAASALAKIKPRINVPLVADIHFDYRLALAALDSGVDALRLNPGNIYERQEVEQIAKAAKKRKISIRVGINSGSIRKNKRTKSLADSMVKSALSYIKMLEKFHFNDIIVSLKSSSVTETVAAYQKLAQRCDYPFHVGVTAAGLPEEGMVKSAIGIGALLLAGIGDTIRVSLAGDAQQEVRVGREILQSLGLRCFGPELLVCPTCGRCQSDVIKIAKELKKELNHSPFTIHHSHSFKIAIMGCEVNGPGEARDADIGLACGKNSGMLFKKGKMFKRVSQDEAVKALVDELKERK